jgi:hypothetical protein
VLERDYLVFGLVEMFVRVLRVCFGAGECFLLIDGRWVLFCVHRLEFFVVECALCAGEFFVESWNRVFPVQHTITLEPHENALHLEVNLNERDRHLLAKTNHHASKLVEHNDINNVHLANHRSNKTLPPKIEQKHQHQTTEHHIHKHAEELLIIHNIANLNILHHDTDHEQTSNDNTNTDDHEIEEILHNHARLNTTHHDLMKT